MKHITLALEFNHNDTGSSLGTVWLFNGDGSADLAKEDALCSLPGWARIVGPIDQGLAIQIVHSLKAFFEESGVSVMDRGISD